MKEHDLKQIQDIFNYQLRLKMNNLKKFVASVIIMTAGIGIPVYYVSSKEKKK